MIPKLILQVKMICVVECHKCKWHAALDTVFRFTFRLSRLTSVSDFIVYTESMPFGILLDINHTY